MLSKALILAANSGYGQPWNIDNFTYDGTPMNTRKLSGLYSYNPRGLFFRADGTELYAISNGGTINTYSLSTAWDISTASYVTYHSPGSITTAGGLFFSSDGLRMYVMRVDNSTVRQYSLSSAWDVSSETFVQSFSVIDPFIDINDVFFSSDGLNMYVVGKGSSTGNPNYVHQYSLSTAWDISTASSYNFFSLSGTKALALFFSSNGDTLYALTDGNNTIYQYALSTAWDTKTASTNPSTFYVPFDGNKEQVSFFFRPNGSTLYVLDWFMGAVSQYSLGTVWDITTASYQKPTTRYFEPSSAQVGSPQGSFFKSDGTKMYLVVANAGVPDSTKAIFEYSLSTAWDISSASYVQNFSVAAQDISPTGVFISPDGFNMYVVGTTGDDVNQYELSTAWDISTASFIQNFSVAAQTTYPRSLFFKPDGTKMYVAGSDTDTVNEYALSTAWNISSASYTQTFSVAATVSAISSIVFKPDGTKMYASNDGNTVIKVTEFSLSTGWDISTAAFVRSFYPNSLVPQQRFLKSVSFNTLGSRMYISDSETNAFWQYDLT